MFTSKVLNPNLYTIELSHGDFTWKIKRRLKHFQALHQELLMFKAPLKLPLPTCMRPKDNQVGMVILYDKGFHIKMSAQETAVHHGVTIENLCRQASVLIIFTFCCDGTASQR
ncbi:uncharacterized protein si:ch211-168k14.2 [Acanthopagrus latus]|uniref:uncharacterized protein si:ch211-168k14.2 n=1 Tax=Acanthopagrus latus TaxID=8177 RepID=UPI00187BD4EA|nr:uncharacterized protein si:ch211-168k14.2 [Acanthopagrus latus]